MRRDDLTMALMQGWARLDLAGRDKFFDEFLRAALRLDQRGLRAWLRRRLRTPPLGLPIWQPWSLRLATLRCSMLNRNCHDWNPSTHPTRRSPAKGTAPVFPLKFGLTVIVLSWTISGSSGLNRIRLGSEGLGR